MNYVLELLLRPMINMWKMRWNMITGKSSNNKILADELINNVEKIQK